MAEEKRIYTGYHPRTQQELLHSNLKRFNVLVCHRRFGKTVFAVNELIDQAVRCEKRNPQYAYIAPTYGQAKRVVWNFFLDHTKNFPGREKNEQDLKIIIPRFDRGDKITIMLLGAENPGTIKGLYLDGVILDEFAEMYPMVWGEVVRPMLADRHGWAIFIGTPKGYNHFYDTLNNSYKDPANWFSKVYKASETGILAQSELDGAKLTMSEEEYEQEFECSFGAALAGAYYVKQMQRAEQEKRIITVPYDRAVGVSTYWDLGMSDTTAIWFVQQCGKEYHVIDHVEDSGQGLERYVKEIKSKDYVYDEHVLPHDAMVRELGPGISRFDSLKALGLQNLRVLERPKANSLLDEVHACRVILDKCWFEAVKCRRGLDALRAYTKKWDEKNQIYSSSPLRNWATHSADAFRTFATGVRDVGSRNKREDLSRSSGVDSYDIFNYAGGD